MSGREASLDDAYEHATKLRASLHEAYIHDAGTGTHIDIDEMFCLADDLASRISNLANTLRS